MDERKTVACAQCVLLRVVLVCLIGLHQARAQSPILQGMIGDVKPDTLLTTLRVLTGEVGSTNGGQSDTIVSRGYRMPGKRLAASFLQHRFVEVGLPVTRDSFQNSVPSISGMNILAEQQGVRFPLQKYILCAHYDATADDTRDSVAPGADDNATGVAAILEAARLVSRYNTDYTVLYALWDWEEVGAFGSDAYAMTARARGDSILGVINLDMLGTDTNNDSVMYVASGTAREIADTVAQLCQLYHVGLKPRLVFPGIESSDHASFIRQKYRAMMLIEYLNTDFSPVNHTSLDRIAMLNLDYFHRQAKLAVLTIAFLAGVGPLSSVAVTNNVAWAFCLEQNYPNPFNPSTTIKFELPKSSDVRLSVYDLLGREVSVLVNERRDAGVHEVRFDALGLSSGVYFYRLQAGTYVETRKLVMLR